MLCCARNPSVRFAWLLAVLGWAVLRRGVVGRHEFDPLGLSIVKEYVLAHEGSVEMINAGSCGGHFRVRLPRVPGAASVGLT
jgi:sensor histidine kinase regulating citrate/malate metabolism